MMFLLVGLHDYWDFERMLALRFGVQQFGHQGELDQQLGAAATVPRLVTVNILE